MDNHKSLIDVRFKDESPLRTVEKIQGILDAHGIQTRVEWHENGVPYCHSLSVRLVNSAFSVNGKGLTRELALASGYGELMERLQLGYTGGPYLQKDGDFSDDTIDYEMISAQELLTRNRKWYERWATLLRRRTGIEMTPESIASQYADDNGLVPVVPYYSVASKTIEYLPNVLSKRLYGSNGSAAGNSTEEAIVQAVSEIVERNHQFRTVYENITLPDIPEEVLQQYKVAYEIIGYIRDKGYRVVMKDCSLGTKFPVVCACIIDTRTGRYYTHFGAYPKFEIALERSLTESFQGRHIDKITSTDDFQFSKPGEYSLEVLTNELSKGFWAKSPDFFVGTPRYPFNKNVGFTGDNNKALLRECMEFFISQGYDVLIQDHSCLGFPTYRIVIPGFSEVFAHRISQKTAEYRYISFARKALRNPATAGVQNQLGLLLHMDEMRKFPAHIIGYRGYLAGVKLSLKLTQPEEDYWMATSLAYTYYALGRYQEAIKCVRGMIRTAKAEDVEYLICLKRYLTLLLNGHEKGEVRKIIEYFHQPETVEKLYGILSRNGNPVEGFAPNCDETCTENCRLCRTCTQKYATELANMISKKTGEIDNKAFICNFETLIST